MINSAGKSISLFLGPIDIIKGSRELLIDLLKHLCDLGYFTTEYHKVLPHFSYNSILLSEDIPVNPIEWGNIMFKFDALMFCGFLKKSKIVKQTYQSLWNHFSHDGENLSKGAYQLYWYGFNRAADPSYKNIRDKRLQYIVKSYFEKLQETPVLI